MAEWLSNAELQPTDLAEFIKFESSCKLNYQFEPLFIKLLWQRGIKNLDQLATFLKADLANLLKAARQIYDIDKAAQEIIRAVKNNTPIIIYGDYDVDGITSTSLLWRFLYRDLKANVIPFVPDRKVEGYGLNLAKIRELAGKDELGNKLTRKLLITVDCGIRDKDLIAQIRQELPLLDVLVTDHHQLPDYNNLPATIIVHPQHPLSTLNNESKEMCACAVVWLLISVIKDLLNIAQSSQYLELVALATVCDVMPLGGINREFVKLGLEELKKTSVAGLRALLRVTKLETSELSSYHLGYILGPRLNASGRIGNAMQAVRLLTTDLVPSAGKIAGELDLLNQKRQELTKAALKNVKEFVAGSSENIIIVANSEWEEGIIGLIAGKLQQEFNLPAIALTQKNKEHWVGSARSNQNIDITKLISSQQKILVKYGGHSQAAGLTVSTQNLAEFMTNIRAEAKLNIDPKLLETNIKYDLEIRLEDLKSKFFEQLNLLEPYGNKNEEPLFKFSNLTIKDYSLIGNGNHIKLYPHVDLADKLELIWFNFSLNPDIFNYPAHDFLGIVGYNKWQGNLFPQVKIKYHHKNEI